MVTEDSTMKASEKTRLSPEFNTNGSSSCTSQPRHRPTRRPRSSPSTYAATSNLWSSSNSLNRNQPAPLALQRSESACASSLPPTPQSKRIYSPYADQAGFRNTDGDDNRDALDRFGEYLADMADRVMWGKYDSDHPSPSPQSTTRPESKSASASSSSSPRTHSRHWKDRMEERMDAMLGIHENGKYYDSWMSKHRENARQAEGTDAFSYARGRSRRAVYNKPIWKEEGTLWTLLFGKASPGQKLQFRDAIDGEPGQLLGVVKLVLRTGLVGAGYACRWASVRGSIPQPFVVMAVSTAALSVRRNRLRTVILVLLGLRTVGELIHSYVLGDEGWEYPTDDDEAESDGATERGAV